MAEGKFPTATSVFVKPMAVTGVVISKRAKLDVPPPGLDTVTSAVPALATSVARMVALNCELLTKVVARALPFQFTVEPLTNPLPFTVRAKPALPGVTAPGTTGKLTNGTGFCPNASGTEPTTKSRTALTATDPRMERITVFPPKLFCPATPAFDGKIGTSLLNYVEAK
jgi:hypothetical protein